MMGNVGCNATAEVAILTLASLFGGCASSGPIVNSVDLAPNFSGENSILKSNYKLTLFYDQVRSSVSSALRQ
jgi:hypothetical protein